MNTIIDFFRNSVKNFPDKIAVIFEESEISYKQLDNLVNSLSNSLTHLEKASIVSIYLENSTDFVVSYLAILDAGMIAHLIPTNLRKEKIQKQLEISQSKLVITSKSMINKINSISYNCEKIIFVESNYNETHPNEAIKIHNENAYLIFTSGTTAEPKGVIITQSNTIFTTKNIVNVLKYTESDVNVLPLPLSHSFGLGCLNCIIKSGATAILHKNTINMPNVISSIKNYQATSFASTPTTFQQIIDNHKLLFQNSIGSIRYLLTNSSPMPNELTNNLLEILDDKKLYTYYGLTEASRSTFHLFKKNDKRINSVGKPLPEVKIKIFIDSRECLPLERGEIYIQGPHVSPGYLSNTSNKKNLHTDWLHTGDIGYFDNDGYLFLVGRKDDMINIGGEKVFPKEIENIIGSMEEIDEVAVKGISDKLLGQIVQVYVVTKQEMSIKDQDIVTFCKGKLENYKIPRIFTYLSKLPKNEQGKLLRSKL